MGQRMQERQRTTAKVQAVELYSPRIMGRGQCHDQCAQGRRFA
ncbi:cell division FtsK/SpoIIIE domain protein [Mycobacterium xenopi 3993]|nr:cell division FtsK/SpoIIIE domain protein [Mycobacterium xenopi 3993]